MSAKYAWQWSGDTKWNATLLQTLRMPRRDCGCLFRRRTTKRGAPRIESIEYCFHSRALINFTKCQIGALAVDMGLSTHAMVKRMEQATDITVEQACYDARQQSSVRVARVLILAAGVGSLTPVRGALTALHLRSPKAGETKPAKLMEAFIQSEFPK